MSKTVEIPAASVTKVRALLVALTEDPYGMTQKAADEAADLLKALPAPEPELGPCPVCGGECTYSHGQDAVACLADMETCPYSGTAGPMAIIAHNKLSRQARVLKEIADQVEKILGPNTVGNYSADTVWHAGRIYTILNPIDESEDDT